MNWSARQLVTTGPGTTTESRVRGETYARLLLHFEGGVVVVVVESTE